MRLEQRLQLSQIGFEARIRATALHFAPEHGRRSVSQPQQSAHHATEYFMVRFAHERLLQRRLGPLRVDAEQSRRGVTHLGFTVPQQ
jgi:hypothetical protein